MRTISVGPKTSYSADEGAIHELFQKSIEAWKRGDSEAYAAQFTEDSDYVAFDGTHLRGRQANAQSHKKLFDTFLKDSEVQGYIKNLRFLTPDVAVLHAVGGIRLRWQSRVSPGRVSIQTFVVVKRDGVWRFTAFHNCRVQRRNRFQLLMLLLGRRRRTARSRTGRAEVGPSSLGAGPNDRIALPCGSVSS
jgi:uncharacterized protein (TIGR02246 family)